MHDIDSPDKSAFCFTVYTGINIHVVVDVAQTYIIDDARHARSGAKKIIIMTPAFLNSYDGPSALPFTKGLLVMITFCSKKGKYILMAVCLA